MGNTGSSGAAPIKVALEFAVMSEQQQLFDAAALRAIETNTLFQVPPTLPLNVMGNTEGLDALNAVIGSDSAPFQLDRVLQVMKMSKVTLRKLAIR